MAETTGLISHDAIPEGHPGFGHGISHALYGKWAEARWFRAYHNFWVWAFGEKLQYVEGPAYRHEFGQGGKRRMSGGIRRGSKSKSNSDELMNKGVSREGVAGRASEEGREREEEDDERLVG